MRRLLLLGVLLMAMSLQQPRLARLQASPEPPWWNDRVFYEVFVRSFYDSDGDGVGDLRGLIEKLDYLNDGDPNTTDDLGVTGIWLMPVQEATRYHGYDVMDYRAVERQYGTADDFRKLMAAAHERGIAVIVDLVLNHTSVLHPWFQASLRGEAPYADWYVWRDADPGYRGPDGQKVWHEYEDRYYYGVFSDSMPDLNLENPDVTAALYDVADFWLNELGVDGFRLDALRHYIEDGEDQINTPETIAWATAFNHHVHEVKPDALTVGEIWSSSYDVAPYIPEAVDIAFEFDLATALWASAQARNPSGVKALYNLALDLYPPGQFASFLTNHDQNRVMSELRGDVGAARVAASVLLTGPGVPFIYYGEEIGMMGRKPDERIRTPMQWTSDPVTAGFTNAEEPWEALADDGLEFTVAAETDDPDSLLSHYRALIHLRNAHPALRTGFYRPLDSEGHHVYAFLRSDETETLLVIVNLDRQPTDDYALSMNSGDLSDSLHAEALFGVAPGTALADPVISDAGGFQDYVPLPQLEARQTVILKLS
ncbi:MAG: DUF3459 domain-containing protein [Anaerolineae bacterium]|nr:DUF3459 domain-containing protein [Anaerolineae bacterium]